MSVAQQINLSISQQINTMVEKLPIAEQNIILEIVKEKFDTVKEKREAILAQGREATERIREQSLLNGVSEMTFEEIEEIIAKVKTEMREEKRRA